MDAHRNGDPLVTPDVAISFLGRDENIARGLNDLLANGLAVFFYPRKQEELAGTDGLESMRTPFLTARVVVVLYREAWGQTPWTRVEQAAITDRFVKEGWEWLLFVQVEDKSKRPVWLPHTHVSFALEQYGVEQLTGAIKMRIQQRGGQINPPTALGKARQVHRDALLVADQDSFFHDQRWISEQLHPRLDNLMTRIQEIGEEISRELGMNFVVRHEGRRCVLRDARISMNVGWRQTYTNVVNDRTNSGLIVSECSGVQFVPSERMMTVFPPKELHRSIYLPTLTLARELRWIEDGKHKPPLSLEELAQAIVSQFLDLIDRANKGRVEFNFT